MQNEEREISALDILRVLRGNWPLLFLGPLVVGVLAWGLLGFAPQSYRSYAVLSLPTSTEFEPAPAATPAQAATMMKSAAVLDPVIVSLHLQNGRSLQRTRADVAGEVRVAPAKDGLLLLDVTANSPTLAQAIANGLIDSWIKSTALGPQERADLGKRLAYAQASLESVTRIIDRLGGENAADLSKPLSRGEAGTSFLGLGQLQIRYLAEVLSISRQMRGLTREVVKQPPTLPTDPESPKRTLISLLVAVLAEIALLVWVFARYFWRDLPFAEQIGSADSSALAAADTPR